MFKLGFIFLCLAFFLFPNLALSEKPVVKIGMVAALNGSMSFYGRGWSSSAQLAIDELGETRYRYELVVEDDASSAAGAVSAFQKLTQIDGARIVLSASANMALALAPLAQRAKLIHLGISSDSSFADANFNFNIWPAPAIPAGSLLMQFRKRGIRNVALLGLEHAWPRAVFAELIKQAGKEGLNITMNEYFEPGERNFRPLLGRLAKSDSEIAVLLSWPPELELFARQYHELQVKVPLTSEWAFEASSQPELFDGFWFVSFPSSKQTYQERFRRKMGYSPYAQMELGDVMVNLIVAACESAGNGKAVPNQEQLSTALLKIRDHQSVYGPVSLDRSGVLQVPYVLKLVRDGKVTDSEN